jgi:hypothetical protein
VGEQPAVRRVVTGRDSDGNVTIVADGPAPAVTELPAVPGSSIVDLWRDNSLPPNVARADDPTLGPFQLMPDGTLFRVIDLAWSDAEPMWHETSSIDFVYVAAGRCTFLSAAGAVELGAGDSIVVRGGQHAWVNRDAEVCRLIDVSVAVPEPSDVTLVWPDQPAAD